ncbi:hypothetical protein HPB50_010000 [Hyalomma asiaticum]|uniref:Uncharacterized protein n=1 Tax=Hyalomma asiaticum TaxID=266040 RepID=A0ACB7RYF0_HYAAI|nr:hypothetical protein HPB50_010000 [Hyalomma asiaticum]
MLIRCLFITQFAGYLAAYVFGTATAHAPDVMQCVAWSSFPRRVMEVTDSAHVGCPIFLADNSDGFPFASSTLTLDPALDKTNVTLDGPITDRHSSTTTWSTTIKASPVDSFISGRGNSGVGIMLIRCLFITQVIAIGLILHVGTNDLTSSTGRTAFEKYRSLFDFLKKERPEINRIYASLILPRSGNRRRGNRNRAQVYHCNRQACHFNSLLREICRWSRLVFYLDHGLEWLPSNRILAADGLHPSFEGVAILASHIRQLCIKQRSAASSSWRGYVNDQPSAPPTGPSTVTTPQPLTPSSSTTASRASPRKNQSPPKEQRNRQHAGTRLSAQDRSTNQTSLPPTRPATATAEQRYPLRNKSRGPLRTTHQKD